MMHLRLGSLAVLCTPAVHPVGPHRRKAATRINQKNTREHPTRKSKRTSDAAAQSLKSKDLNRTVVSHPRSSVCASDEPHMVMSRSHNYREGGKAAFMFPHKMAFSYLLLCPTEQSVEGVKHQMSRFAHFYRLQKTDSASSLSVQD